MGEVITSEEAEERGKKYGKCVRFRKTVSLGEPTKILTVWTVEKCNFIASILFITDAEGRTYLFDLDFNMGNENPYTVDAAFYGNVSHFINHR